MQRPILKDGVVVNVVELKPGTYCCAKAELRELMAEEDAAYAAQLAAWRETVKGMQRDMNTALANLDNARQVAGATQQRVMKARQSGKAKSADALLNSVLEAGEQVTAHEQRVAELAQRVPPEKPTFARPHRWVVPEGCEVGEPGGNIGDTWDGQRYVPPADKTVVKDREPIAEKV